MIKEIIKKTENPYGRFFLSLEAPDDDPSQIKRNTKVIEIKPNNRRRIDFTSGYEELDDEPDLPEEGETTQQDFEPTVDDPKNPDASIDYVNLDLDDNTDYTYNALYDPNDNAGMDDDSTEVNTDTDYQDPNLDNPPAEDPNAEDPNAQPEIDPNTGQPVEDPNAPPQKRGPGLEYDSTRKYILFLNFESLINAIANYITKLEGVISDDIESNRIVKTANKKLKEIKDLCFDYITMKFETSSYVQSLMFYQNTIVMVQMIFDMLGKMSKYIKINTEE